MRKLVALAFCLVASSAFAGCDPFHVRDPVMQPPPASVSLPDLGSSGGSDWFRDERPRGLPDTQAPLGIDPRGPRPELPGAPWYWQDQPLYPHPVP